MKFDIGQKVVLLTTEGRPVLGEAFIVSHNPDKHTYKVSHNTESRTETYQDIPEERIIDLF